MAGPPTDVEPSELWRRLSEAPRPSEVIDFPRTDADGRPLGRVRIQVLTMEQHDEARIRAHRYLRDKRKLPNEDLAGESIREVYGDAVARELLCMACLSPEAIRGTGDDVGTAPRYSRIFPSADAIGERLTADEVATLFTAYLMVQQRFGPYEGNTTGPDVDEWVRRLVEGGRAYPLAPLNWHQLADLTLSLAQRLWSVFQSLESQRESLPSSLVSELESLGFGMSLSGEPPENYTPISGSDDVDRADVPPRKLATTIDTSEAQRIAARFFKVDSRE